MANAVAMWRNDGGFLEIFFFCPTPIWRWWRHMLTKNLTHFLKILIIAFMKF